MRRQPFHHRFRVEERLIEFRGRGFEDAVKTDGIRHALLPNSDVRQGSQARDGMGQYIAVERVEEDVLRDERR
jgi:hypothetical protein